jgi:hypothetical protein
MAVQVKSGARLRSVVCETEIVVIRARAAEVDLRCGGRPMAPREQPPAAKAAPQPGYDTPTQLGKRYADDADTLEVLCTVAGSSSLSLGDVPLVIRGPKPLPASD